jgi:HK97 family phage portal protein
MNFLKKAASIFRRKLDVQSADGWKDLGGCSHSGELVSLESALALSTVWACVGLLAGTIASLPLMVYRKDRTGNRQVASDHPLYDVLHDSPNADQTALDFWEYQNVAIELRGNAYARKDFIGQRLVGLSPISPSAMTVRRLDNGQIGYRWTEYGKQYEATDREILHIRGFGGSPLGGLSTLTYARHTFGLAQSIERTAGNVFARGMRVPGAIKFPDILPDEKADEVYKRIGEKYLGALNFDRPLILEGGSEWQAITINPEDAQMLESRGFEVEDICRFFGVPPHMVGRTEKTSSWGTGLEQQVLAFQKFTLRRRLRRIEQALEKQLLTPADKANGIGVEFSMEGLLRGDSKARADFYNIMLRCGAMTINEARAFENLSAVPGGDEPRIQMQNVPITDVGGIQQPQN